jgi:predicted transcriptional regulator
MAEDAGDERERVRRIPARVPAQVDGLASMRLVARAMVESGVHAVLVESPAGPVGLVTASDVIEALAVGADPDVVWAGEMMRPATRMVSCDQHPVAIGEEMAAHNLEIIAVIDEDARMGVASALDILGAVVGAGRELRHHDI